MARTLALVLLATLPPFLLVLIVSFRLFDRLLRIQFSDARSEWEQMGSPSGYFWSPPGSRKLSLRARGYLWSQWFYHAPPWVRGSEQASGLYARFKQVGWLATFAFTPVFLAFVGLLLAAVRIVLLTLTGFDRIAR